MVVVFARGLLQADAERTRWRTRIERVPHPFTTNAAADSLSAECLRRVIPEYRNKLSCSRHNRTSTTLEIHQSGGISRLVDLASTTLVLSRAHTLWARLICPAKVEASWQATGRCAATKPKSLFRNTVKSCPRGLERFCSIERSLAEQRERALLRTLR